MTTTDTHHLMTVDEVAAYLRVPVWTVRKWRSTGHGPLARKIGKHLRYRREDVETWLLSR